MPEDLPTPPALCPATTSSMRILYCLRSAEKALGTKIGGFSFLLVLQENQRADERTRTADLSLRVIGHVLQGFAEACKSAFLEGFPFPVLLRVALYCVPGGIRVVSISSSYPPNIDG